MFFEENANIEILKRFLNNAKSIDLESDVLNKRFNICIKIITSMKGNPKAWDDRCSFNIEHIGNNFIDNLSSFSANNTGLINYIYTDAYRFLCEFDFTIGQSQELSFDLQSILHSVRDDIIESDSHLQSQITYASLYMPAAITKQLLNSNGIGTIKEFSTKVEQAKTLNTRWDKELKDKLSEVKDLKNRLDEHKTAFNFVGLYDGFAGLAETKAKEGFWLFISLIGMGVLILAPLIIEIAFTMNQSIKNIPITKEHLYIVLPIISIEIVLIYFFRIILMNHRSVKAQIIQLELRKTLCQFIQSYSEYSTKIKKEDDSALDKFENLIFSGVLSDPSQLPSTFDGIDQIGKFIKNIKGS